MTQATIEVRPATEADRVVVAALATALATSGPVSQDAFEAAYTELLDAANAVVLVAVVGGRVRGYLLGFDHLTFFANGRVGWVEEVMVDAGHRTRGLGRALMAGFEDWASRRHCAMVALATRRAADFYQALGYEESATYFRKWLGASQS
ncbi:MAG TPA: GNAT family N-acetyltransferase [Jiangellaceae bacterium]